MPSDKIGSTKVFMLFPILHDSKVLRNVLKKSTYDDFATPAWPSQLWYSEAMGMSMQQPIFLTWRRDLLKRPKGEIHPLAQNKTLKLVA